MGELGQLTEMNHKTDAPLSPKTITVLEMDCQLLPDILGWKS